MATDPATLQALQRAKVALDNALQQRFQERNAEDRKFMVANLGKDIGESLAPLQFLILEKLDEQAQSSLAELKILIAEFNKTMKDLKIETPKVNIQAPDVKIPEIKIPDIKIPKIESPKIPIIKVPKPEVTVKVPNIKVPQVQMPDKIRISGPVTLEGFGMDNPLPVQLRDQRGEIVDLLSNLRQVVSQGGGARRPNVPGSSFAVVDTASSGDNTIVAAVTNQRVKVLSYFLVAAAAVDCRWKSGNNSLSGAMPFAANSGIASPVGSKEDRSPLLQTNIGEALVLNLSAAVQVSGHISYWVET